MLSKKRTGLLITLMLLAGAAILVYRVLTTGPTGSHTITVARCVGYCNLSLFVTAKKTDVESSDFRVSLKYIANPGDHASALVSPNGPQAAVTPFTNVLAAFGNGQPVRIIAGSGMNGLALLSRPDIKSISDLKGKKLGTFRADTLEILAYQAVKRAGISKDVNFIYFADALEPLAALRNGEIDALTHVEPFVSQLSSQNGMNILLRGENLWQSDHPDCVLISTVNHIAERRADLKRLIAEMLIAQHRIEVALPAVAEDLAEPFYKMSPVDLVTAGRAQFPQVDIRDKMQFIIRNGDLLMDLGYIKSPPTESIFDFSLLEEVVNEKPELLTLLRHKALTR